MIKRLKYILKCPTHNHYGFKERLTLTELSGKSDVVWKPAVKAGGLVLMNKLDYISEVTSQLSDVTYYMKLDSYPIITLKIEVDMFLHESHQKGSINQSELTFLTNDFPVMPVMLYLRDINL